MLKKLLVTTAITTLMIGAAAAEGNPPTSRANEAPAVATPPPAATTPPPAAAPAAKSTEMSKPSTDMSKPATTASSAKFINSQRSDQFLASKFKGTDVLGTDDQKIGDVSDLLFDKTGRIQAYVISVGGFLGMGSKNVALAPDAFQVVPGDPNSATSSSPKLKISMSKDELKNAANFEAYKEPSRATTGTAPGGSTRPAPGGMAK